jgi:GMP synthase-like glutamine amidotransferase
MIRAHVFQHVPFEGLAHIAEWLDHAGAVTTCTRFYENAAIPAVTDFDLLIVMGGPMSVNEEHLYPWLPHEKSFIRQAVEKGKAVLGICLGAQLIASAMGARVYANKQKEIGWFPVSGCRTTARQPTLIFPPLATMFHWHGETFDLPDGAIQLARSEACENQAFQLGERVVALQFHLEMTSQSLRDMVSHCGSELVPAPYVQSEERIINPHDGTLSITHKLMADVLAFVTRG